MTRKRLGTGLVEAFSTTCEHCHGRGIIVHSEPIEVQAATTESTRSQSGGSRRKRGRDKSAPEPVAEVVVEETAAPAPSQEELARRAAHPVALAMAAHHPEHSDSDSTDAPVTESANAGADAPAAQTPAGQEADPVKISEPLRAADPGRIADAARSESGTGEDATTVTTPADEPEEVAEEIAAAEAAVAKAAPKSVEAEKVSAQESDSEPAPRRRRARRVARPAAPAGDADAAATVFVLPAPAADSTPVTPPAAAPVSTPEDASPSADEPAVKVVRRTRSRRAAGRPAGPPVDAEA